MIAQSYLDFQAQMLHPKNLFVFYSLVHKNKISRNRNKKSLSKWGRINQIRDKLYSYCIGWFRRFNLTSFSVCKTNFYLPDLTSLSLTPSSALSSLHSAAAAVCESSKLAQAKKSHAVNLEK